MEPLKAIKAAYLKNARDVRIPVDLIPQVIGKGGKGIQDLQSTHDVRINIDKMDRGLVHLRGETEGLDSAVEALLAMKVAHEARTRTLEFDQEATGILVGRGGSTTALVMISQPSPPRRSVPPSNATRGDLLLIIAGASRCEDMRV